MSINSNKIISFLNIIAYFIEIKTPKTTEYTNVIYKIYCK